MDDVKQLRRLKDDRGVALVELYASWCPHCKKMMPIVDDVRSLLEGKITVYQFDIDDNPELADELGVKSIPTFLIYKNGEQMWHYTGEIEANTLVDKLQSYI